MFLLVRLTLISALTFTISCKSRMDSVLQSETVLENKSYNLQTYRASEEVRAAFHAEFQQLNNQPFCSEAYRITHWNPFRAKNLPFRSLNPEEMLSLEVYTRRDFYKRLNGPLREANADQLLKVKNTILILSSALNGLPNHAGEVFRGANLPPEIIEGYRQAAASGQPVTEKHFLSTTLDPKIANSFGSVLFRLKVKTGHNIEAVSRYPAEREILMPPGADFKVTAVQELEPAALEGILKTPVPEIIMPKEPFTDPVVVDCGTAPAAPEKETSLLSNEVTDKFSGPVAVDSLPKVSARNRLLQETKPILIDMVEVP